MQRLAVFVLLVFALCVAQRPARACAGFATRNVEPPFLAGERVLLIAPALIHGGFLGYAPPSTSSRRIW